MECEICGKTNTEEIAIGEFKGFLCSWCAADISDIIFYLIIIERRIS